ncbi:hypothetical protein COLO4_13664 [Corchorus olitorius]|uniref:Uncharacterized protein n=1 Tax=Corchorus olitorius TaxID=93759 RepID=A0A1R3JVD7_9ROSI|nr:hypothetical protein COLO4_13664 [Corchorus olitorius]
MAYNMDDFDTQFYTMSAEFQNLGVGSPEFGVISPVRSPESVEIGFGFRSFGGSLGIFERD